MSAQLTTQARHAGGHPCAGRLFFVGAHAAVAGWPVLTRDMRRYAGYFPTVELVAHHSGWR